MKKIYQTKTATQSGYLSAHTINLSASDFILQTAANIGQIPAKQTINGSSRADILTGSNLSDILYGFAGDDKLLGNDGDDEIYDGSGKDRIYAKTGADLVWRNKGNDKLYLGNDQDSDTVIYRAGDGTDVIYTSDVAAGNQAQFPFG